jgi:hypothetical protein
MPDMMEISLDEGDWVVMLREAAIERDHEALYCDEEFFCAFFWRMGVDFGVEVSGALAEEVCMVADL